MGRGHEGHVEEFAISFYFPLQLIVSVALYSLQVFNTVVRHLYNLGSDSLIRSYPPTWRHT